MIKTGFGVGLFTMTNKTVQDQRVDRMLIVFALID